MKIPRWRPWAYYAIGTAGIVVLSLIGRMVDHRLTIALSLLSVVWLLLCSVAAWKRTDEAAREAHKFAWFWGGGFGAMAAIALLIMAASAMTPAPNTTAPQGRGNAAYTLNGGRISLSPVRREAVPGPAMLQPDEQVVTRAALLRFLLTGILLGGLLVMLGQSLGYFLTWMGWWVTKR